MAVATNQSEFERLVTVALADLDLEASEFENVEPFYVRMAHSPDPELRELVDCVSPAEPVHFGPFHVYESDDE